MNPGSEHLTPRLRRYAEEHFPAGIVERLQSLAAEGVHGNQDPERVLTGILLLAGEAGGSLDAAVELARVDWRDLLVAAGLANEDWPRRLDEVLG